MAKWKNRGGFEVRVNLGFIGLLVMLVGGLFIALGLAIPVVGVLFLVIGIIIGFVGLIMLLLLDGIKVRAGSASN